MPTASRVLRRALTETQAARDDDATRTALLDLLRGDRETQNLVRRIANPPAPKPAAKTSPRRR